MAENLWALRQRRNMKIGELASKSGIPAKQLEAYEKGESVKVADLKKLARALFVDPSQIKIQSDPKGAPPKPPVPMPRKPVVQGEDEAKPVATAPVFSAPVAPHKKKYKKGPSPNTPAAVTQIEHLVNLARRFGETQEMLETAVNKPLTDLTSLEIKEVLKQYQTRSKERKPTASSVTPNKLKRAYLPEAVDTFELNYLTAQQKSQSEMTFTLLTGKMLNGRIIGFSPYAITIQQPDGSETTIQKLALAYYSTQPTGGE